MKNAKLILQIAATYVGTVIGAGFATGQSILQFFTRYGTFGTAGTLISTLLFLWIGTKMMILSRRIKAYSYQELNLYLFGKWGGKIVNLLTFLSLFAVTAVMLSGTGSLFEEQLHWPYQLSVIAVMSLSYMILRQEMKGIVAVNSLVSPIMMGFSLLIAVKVVGPGALLMSFKWPAGVLQDATWTAYPFIYVSLNLAIAQAVLVPLGSESEDEKALIGGGLLGGAGIGLMLWISHAAMLAEMPGIMRFDIPMAEMIRDLGPSVHVLFLLVIIGEIFTTLVGNVYGITRQIRKWSAFPKDGVMIFTLLACFLISQAGFVSLLAWLYPLIGYLGLALLFALSVNRMPDS